MVERLFLGVPRGCLPFVIVVFPDHTHLLFLRLLISSLPVAVSRTHVNSLGQPLDSAGVETLPGKLYIKRHSPNFLYYAIIKYYILLSRLLVNLFVSVINAPVNKLSVIPGQILVFCVISVLSRG